MSAISHTTPQHSSTKKLEKFDELTQEEREAILDDKYGRRSRTGPGRRRSSDSINNNDNDSTNNDIRVEEEENTDNNNDNENNGNNNNEDDDNDNDITEELLEQFDLALQSIPDSDMIEYMAAVFACPQVVRDESNEERFLRSTNYNPQAAALKLVEYWKIRVEIFGEAAFEPLTLEDAMSDIIGDMVSVPNFYRILPNDDHGRTVLCLDRTNIVLKDYDEMIFIKILWFVTHVALQRRSTQKNGVVCVTIDRVFTWDFPSRKLMKFITGSLTHALPVKLCCRHLCISALVATYVLPVAKYFLSREARLRIQVHSSIKTPTVLNELESFGLHRDKLPTSIGGNYNIKPAWIIDCERILKEQQRAKRRASNRAKRQRDNPY